MNPKQVATLNRLQEELGKLITEVCPSNDGEWKALESMTAAHRGLRGIDRTPLGQQSLLD